MFTLHQTREMGGGGGEMESEEEDGLMEGGGSELEKIIREDESRSQARVTHTSLKRYARPRRP